MVVTTTSITAVSVSIRSAHSTCRSPDTMNGASTTRASWWPKPTCTKPIQESTIEANSSTVVTSSDGRAPITRPNRPAMALPSSGRKTIAWYMLGPCSALHQVHVFHRDRAAVAEVDDEDREPDRSLRGGNGEHDEREHLADQVAEMAGERHQVDVDGEQDQLDRHQDDDHVLAVKEDAENPEREQDRGDREIMAEADGHHLRCPPPAGRDESRSRFWAGARSARRCSGA